MASSSVTVATPRAVRRACPDRWHSSPRAAQRERGDAVRGPANGYANPWSPRPPKLRQLAEGTQPSAVPWTARCAPNPMARQLWQVSPCERRGHDLALRIRLKAVNRYVRPAHRPCLEGRAPRRPCSMKARSTSATGPGVRWPKESARRAQLVDAGLSAAAMAVLARVRELGQDAAPADTRDTLHRHQVQNVRCRPRSRSPACPLHACAGPRGIGARTRRPAHVDELHMRGVNVPVWGQPAYRAYCLRS
jgi:hypothetical protein